MITEQNVNYYVFGTLFGLIIGGIIISQIVSYYIFKYRENKWNNSPRGRLINEVVDRWDEIDTFKYETWPEYRTDDEPYPENNYRDYLDKKQQQNKTVVKEVIREVREVVKEVPKTKHCLETRCIHCGSPGRGKCRSSPNGYHTHEPNGKNCVFCGSYVLIGNCPNSPSGRHSAYPY